MKKEIDNGGPVFPFEYRNQTSSYQPGFFGTDDLSPGASQQFAGATLRDYFAAKAMQGICSDNTTQKSDDETYEDFAKDVADSSYIFADAMLEARK